MVKLFFIYALIAGIIMTYYGFVSIREDLEQGIEKIKEEYEVTDTQIRTVFFILLYALGWAWLPYKVVKSIIKLIKGRSNES